LPETAGQVTEGEFVATTVWRSTRCGTSYKFHEVCCIFNIPGTGRGIFKTQTVSKMTHDILTEWFGALTISWLCKMPHHHFSEQWDNPRP